MSVDVVVVVVHDVRATEIKIEWSKKKREEIVRPSEKIHVINLHIFSLSFDTAPSNKKLPNNTHTHTHIFGTTEKEKKKKTPPLTPPLPSPNQPCNSIKNRNKN